MAPDRQHEEYAIAIVEPAPLPEEVPIFRNMVSDFVVNNLGRAVHIAGGGPSPTPWASAISEP